MNLRQLYLRNNACFKAGRTMQIKGIMVHSTGANNTNLRRYVGPDDGKLGHNVNNNHWNIEHPDGRNIGAHPFVAGANGRCTTCGGRQVCVHAWIGKLADGSIATYQTLPWDMKGWHCGVGSKGTANESHIAVEICEDGLGDRAYFDAVYQEAVEFCAYLCRMFKLNPLTDGVLIDHAEGHRRGIAGNHKDVGHWFARHGKSMDTLRDDVAKLLGRVVNTATPEPPKAITKYPISDANIQSMVGLGIINSPQYWAAVDSVQWLNELMANVAKSGMCDMRINNRVPSVDVALDVLVDAGIINSPEYWKGIAQQMPVQYIDALLIAMANKCVNVLEKIVMAEAGGEGLEGQEYVANVILNRVRDNRFPSGIYPVVFAGAVNSAGKMVYQFMPVGNGAYARAKPSASVKDAVTNVLGGKDKSKGALYFCTKASAAGGNWHERSLVFLLEHRNHRFYK